MRLGRVMTIVNALGEDAFRFLPLTKQYGPGTRLRYVRPLSGRQIAELKKEYLRKGWNWPFEHVEPFSKPVPVRSKPPKGHKHERNRPAREATIAKNMALMPKWIEEMRARKRVPDDVSEVDRYFLSKKQLYYKYVKLQPAKK